MHNPLPTYNSCDNYYTSTPHAVLAAVLIKL